MSWGGPGFFIAIIAISTIGWVLPIWIRARHGYPIERAWGGTASHSDPDADRKLTLLIAENDKLHGQVSRLEERLAVLERIATDPAERIARDIDALR